MKHIVSLLTLVISITGTSFGQTYTLKDFKEIKLPEINTKEWTELNYSQHAFQVSADYGEIRITKASKEKKQRWKWKTENSLGRIAESGVEKLSFFLTEQKKAG